MATQSRFGSLFDSLSERQKEELALLQKALSDNPHCLEKQVEEKEKESA